MSRMSDAAFDPDYRDWFGVCDVCKVRGVLVMRDFSKN
jgi:hypothetical protein